jgi:hypothetical protein
MGCNDAALGPIGARVDIAPAAVSAAQAVLEIGNRKIATQPADQ